MKRIDPAESIAPKPGAARLRMIIVVSVLALGYFAFDKFAAHTGRERRCGAVPNESRSAITEKSIAVLAVRKSERGKSKTQYFTDGVQDQILTDLSQIADLKVISRT